MARIYEAVEGVLLPLGRRGENEALEVRVNIKQWIADYGNGAFGGLAQRYSEDEPYPVTITVNGDYACWLVTDVDTAIEGYGKFELDYIVGGVLAKSVVWRTKVQPSVAEPGPVPDPYESWVEDVLAAGASVLNKIDKVVDADAGNLPKLKADGSIEDSDVPAADVLTKLDSATAGDLAALTADGDLQDSGIAAADVALQDGYYEDMTVGAAETLTGRGEGVLANLTFRTAGGDVSIGDGTAQIQAVRGNTLMWNQLAPAAAPASNWAGYGGTISATDDVISLTVTSATANPVAIAAQASKSPRIFAGRKYFMTADLLLPRESASASLRLSTASGVNYVVSGAAVPANKWTTISGAFTADTDVSNARSVCVAAGQNTTGFQIDEVLQFRNVMVFDLTAMFGSGNEPSADEFRLLFPLGYYTPQQTPIPIHYNGIGIQTVGFNQWDEVWEIGSISSSTGANSSGSTSFRSKNFILVFPDTNYYFNYEGGYGDFQTGSRLYPRWYDANKNYIGAATSLIQGVLVSPPNARYLRFVVTNSTQYQDDITINLSWSGYRNGEREAYWTQTRELPVSTYFPTGMKSAGAVYDELRSDKAIQRIAGTTVGDQTWAYSAAYAGSQFYTTISAITTANVSVAGYTPFFGAYSALPDKSYVVNLTNNRLTIRDDAYTDAASFKTALADTAILYELATPVETEIDPPLNLSYRVSDFGTERSLPDNTATPATAPMKAMILYGLNVQDTVRRLPIDYMSMSNFEALCSALSSSLGVAVTATYNETTESYNFAITDNRPLRIVPVPASATAAGTAGNIAFDNGYLYLCLTTGEAGEAVWKRVALSTWS